MPQDAQQPTLPTDATTGPAATMPETDYHPFAEEIRQMTGQPPQGASAPEPASVPEGQQAPGAPPQVQPPEGQPPPEEPVDFRARYEELQRQVEAEHQRRQAQEQQFEQTQKQWLEAQQQLNARQAEEARQRAEQQYNAQLKAAFERAVAADDDEAGLKVLDEFVRKDIAGQLSQHFQSQIEAERTQYQEALENYRKEAEQQLVSYYKPGFARELVQKHGLPENAVNYLMTAQNVEQMPAMAEQMQQLLAQAAPQIQQRVIEQKVNERRDSGVQAVGGVSGGPLPPRELKPMSADSPEAVAIARALLSS